MSADNSFISEAARQEFLQSTESLGVTLHGREVNFRYPNSVFMRNVVALIFQGEEYPILPLPQYAPTTIIDVGANVGAAAFYFLNSYPSAQVYCYEPSDENFRCLRENASAFPGNIHVFRYGLLDRDCEVPLYRGTSQTGQNAIVPSSETTSLPTEHVRLVKASREVMDRGWGDVSILKIDTEGCEVPILGEFLTAIPQIDILYCEYHSDDDRRRIDAMTEDRFLLCWCKATAVHRGICVYASKNLITRYPQLGWESKSVVNLPQIARRENS